MLTRLSIKNFRLLRDVTIDVEPGKPIVLIGPNSSGKSSVIQVLDLLGRFGEEGFNRGVDALGGVKSFATRFASDRSVVLETLFSAGGTRLRHEVRLEARAPNPDVLFVLLGPDRVIGEGLDISSTGDDKWIHAYSYDGTNILAYDSRTKSYNASETIYGLSFEGIKDKSAYPFLDTLHDELSNIRVYDGFLTTPLWSRNVREGKLSPFDSAVVRPCPRIDRRGLDLINALYYIHSSDPEAWDDLMRAFCAEFPFVQRLEFPADPAGGSIALGWRDRRHPGERMLGHQMSEGMASYLCLLAAILSLAPATAIAFDEPDRHLHPSALRRIVYLLEQLSTKTAVFIATHSDRFLDHLSDPAGSLRVCEPSEDGVKITKLDPAVIDEWRKDYTLSELRNRGHLDPANADATEL